MQAGAHVLAIKDMAGLLRPPAARALVTALRSRFDLPVHLHTHDTAGGQLATLITAIDAGVDAVDAAVASMAGTTSQPSLSALVAATDHTDRATGLSLAAVGDLEPYWEAVRKVYAPFESGLAAPTGRVYHHEIPGGQLSNLRQQAIALGLEDRFELIEDCYAAADRMLGRLVKVTPSSKVVGDLALHLVGAGVSAGGLRGRAGRLRRAGLGDRVPARRAGRPARRLAGAVPHPGAGRPPPETGGRRAVHRGPPRAARRPAGHAEPAAVPRPGQGVRRAPGGLRRTPTCCPRRTSSTGWSRTSSTPCDLEPGVTLLIELEAISEADERGYRNVLATLNGQLRPVSVRDESIATDVKAAEKADRSDPNQVAAPFAGVVTLQVGEGDTVEAGQTVATIEAMKMEASITAHDGGTRRAAGHRRGAAGRGRRPAAGPVVNPRRSARTAPSGDRFARECRSRHGSGEGGAACG